MAIGISTKHTAKQNNTYDDILFFSQNLNAGEFWNKQLIIYISQEQQMSH